MKKATRFLAALAAMTTLIVSAMPVSADNNVLTSAWTPADISKTVGELTTELKFSDESIAILEHTEKNGIVFETEGNVDVSKLNLKYDFANSNSVEVLGWTLNCGREDCEEKNVYVYLADENTSKDELKCYAEELSSVEGIKYADEFTICSESKGWLVDSSKDNFCLYIGYRLGEKIYDEEEFAAGLEEYREKLNSNKELMAYLESIGADNEITIGDDAATNNLLRISGIDDRTKIFEIGDKLKSFEDIGNNFMILSSILCEPTYSITFADRECAGDANGDGTLNIRDCAKIAQFAAQGKTDSLPNTADYNKDGNKNVRDAAAISKDLASK